MTGKQISVQNADVAETSDICEECGRSVALKWHYCAFCGAEL